MTDTLEARTRADRRLVHDIREIDPTGLARFGGKAAGLARMHGLGLPVPPAFVIDTEACRQFQHRGGLPPEVDRDIDAALAELERRTGKRFAARDAGRGAALPLLVSVRSGAQISMPGMMDTVLNLGLDSRSVLTLADASGDARFAVDTWARFWAMYSDIVLDVDPGWLAQETAASRRSAAADLTPVSAAAFEAAVIDTLAQEGHQVGIEPRHQLTAAIHAVFRSWDSRRARLYREHHGISHDLGTAVTVQAMVFGNLGAPAGSGVAFTRDPKTGARELFGEYLSGGQGEDVVAGTRTPTELRHPSEDWIPLIGELGSFGDLLETDYRDALDIEFTAEAGTLYLLQVRPAKRTAAAAVHIAVDLLEEGVIDVREALNRVTVEQVKRLVAPEFDERELDAARSDGRLLTIGIAASPGHGSGRAVLDADRAGVLSADGTDVVLLRPTTSPQDLRGMLAAQAVVTARGGATSHAAVVSRALDKPCVVGCEDLVVRPDERTFSLNGRELAEGDEVSVDGSTGEVLAGIIPRSVPHRNIASLTTLLELADQVSGCAVWSRATGAGVAQADGLEQSPGVAIVSLTDLLVSTGGIGELITAIESYSASADAPAKDIEEVVERITYDAVRPLLESVGDRPVHLRVPTMTSPRARRWIHEWTSLAPHLLLPMGPRRLLRSYLAAVGRAARESSQASVSLLLGGITHATELAAFQQMLEPTSPISVGAVVQNPVVLHSPEALADNGGDIWIDLAELVRTSCGRPEELLYLSTEVNGVPAPGGVVDTELPGLITDQLSALVAAFGRRPGLGIEVAGHVNPHFTRILFDAGFRRFTSTAGQSHELRLALGQFASKKGAKHD